MVALLPFATTLLAALVVATPHSVEKHTNHAHGSLSKRDLPTMMPTWGFFTTEYFLQNALFVPRPDACVFYTRRLNWQPGDSGLSATANCIAHQCRPRMTTIWDLWQSTDPLNYYDMGSTSWLRNIAADETAQASYFRNMSTAFALLCSGTITVVTEDPMNIPEEGIWYDTEYQNLVLERDTTSIWAVNIWMQAAKLIWTPPQKMKREAEPSFEIEGARLSRRSSSAKNLLTRDYNICPLADPNTCGADEGAILYQPTTQDWFG